MQLLYIFSLMNTPHRLGHLIGEKIKLLEMKRKKKLHGFSYSKHMANFETVHIDHFIKHKPLISEE